MGCHKNFAFSHDVLSYGHLDQKAPNVNKRTFLYMSLSVLTAFVVASTLFFCTWSNGSQNRGLSLSPAISTELVQRGRSGTIPGTQRTDVLLSLVETKTFTHWVDGMAPGRSSGSCGLESRDAIRSTFSAATLCKLLAAYYWVQLEDVTFKINRLEARWPDSTLLSEHTCLLVTSNVHQQLKLNWFSFSTSECQKMT